MPVQPTNPTPPPYPPSAQPGSPPTAPPPGPARPSRRHLRLVVGVAAAVLVLALVGLGVSYGTGTSTDNGRFATAPAACSLLDNDLASKFTPGGVVTPGDQGCEISVNDDRRPERLILYIDRVTAEGRTGAPKAASATLRRAELGGFRADGGWRRLTGLGDEAIIGTAHNSTVTNVLLVVRISNLVLTFFGSHALPLGSPANATPGPPPVDGATAVAKEVVHRLPAH